LFRDLINSHKALVQKTQQQWQLRHLSFTQSKMASLEIALVDAAIVPLEFYADF